MGSKVWGLEQPTSESNLLIKKLIKMGDLDRVHAVVGIWIAYRAVLSNSLPRFVGDSAPPYEDVVDVLITGLQDYLGSGGEPGIWDSRFLDWAYYAYTEWVGRIHSVEHQNSALPEYVETQHLDRLAVTAQQMLELLNPYRENGKYVVPEQEVEAFCRQSALALFQCFREPDNVIRKRLSKK